MGLGEEWLAWIRKRGWHVERRWDYLGKLCIAMMMMMMMINSALCIKILLQSSYLNDVGATVMDIC
jgi:hypothetical protein